MYLGMLRDSIWSRGLRNKTGLRSGKEHAVELCTVLLEMVSKTVLLEGSHDSRSLKPFDCSRSMLLSAIEIANCRCSMITRSNRQFSSHPLTLVSHDAWQPQFELYVVSSIAWLSRVHQIPNFSLYLHNIVMALFRRWQRLSRNSNQLERMAFRIYRVSATGSRIARWIHFLEAPESNRRTTVFDIKVPAISIHFRVME